jgi:hypothetical protein
VAILPHPYSSTDEKTLPGWKTRKVVFYVGQYLPSGAEDAGVAPYADGWSSCDARNISFARLPRGNRQLGFYPYGEISPFGTGHCDLRNQTMTLTTIQETADCHAQSA